MLIMRLVEPTVYVLRSGDVLVIGPGAQTTTIDGLSETSPSAHRTHASVVDSAMREVTWPVMSSALDEFGTCLGVGVGTTFDRFEETEKRLTEGDGRLEVRDERAVVAVSKAFDARLKGYASLARVVRDYVCREMADDPALNQPGTEIYELKAALVEAGEWPR